MPFVALEKAEARLADFIRVFPNDTRPKKALEVARKCLESPAEANIRATYAAADAARDAASAAYDASDRASAAACADTRASAAACAARANAASAAYASAADAARDAASAAYDAARAACAAYAASAYNAANPANTAQGGGKKFDSGKPPISLIPRAALEQEAQVFAFGAKKYGRDNFKLGMDWSRIIDASLRHIIAFANGEDNDAETGMSHLAHARCCLSMLLYYIEHKKGTDDRYKGDILTAVTKKENE